MQGYHDAKCYLKGIFNAIEAFRSDRDSKSWHIESSIDSAALLEYSHKVGFQFPVELQGDYPLLTKASSEMLLLRHYKYSSMGSSH